MVRLFTSGQLFLFTTNGFAHKRGSLRPDSDLFEHRLGRSGLSARPRLSAWPIGAHRQIMWRRTVEGTCWERLSNV